MGIGACLIGDFGVLREPDRRKPNLT
jgi:hypothetical protein